jgi:hypothetical protein
MVAGWSGRSCQVKRAEIASSMEDGHPLDLTREAL